MVLVMPTDPTKIFDLDNVACLEGKEVIGFISDIVGPVQMPLYAVTLYKDFVLKNEQKEALSGEKVFLV